ncbi:hypothetical protein QAD02_006194 [Eretmocerus hayati]|uniref:Uncharacterized protein n=1 Tax=Eretmocerus hayati TaxID=131215 RepID=A0ACC2N0E6_9HYME|nr:hypothetical protein QAD02_006194 [Eretmocerus hayati]
MEMIRRMNRSVEPCHDFYEFACGQYAHSAFIPPEQEEYDVMTQTRDEIGEELRTMINEPPEEAESEAFKKLKAYYRNCLQRESPEDTGAKDLKELFTQLGGWPLIEGSSWDESEFDWKIMMSKFRKVGLNHDHFIRLAIIPDKNDPNEKTIFIDPPGMDLPHPQLENLKPETLKSTLNEMAALTQSFGIDTVSSIEALEEIALFMVDLYKLNTAPINHPYGFRNFSNIEELQSEYPDVQWLSYINGILPSSIRAKNSDKIVIFNPEYFSNLNRAISQTEKRVLANYIFYREAESLVRYTNLRSDKGNSSTAEESLAMEEENAVFCMNQVSSNLPYALSALYVKEFFDDELITSMSKLVYHLTEKYRRVLRETKWMDDTTTARAIEKIQRMHSFVGYPHDLLDEVKLNNHYASFEVHPKSFLKTQLNVMQLKYFHHYKEMMDTYNEQDWFRKLDNSFSTLPYYSPITNKLLVPAGFFKRFVAEKDYPKYMRYGYFGPHIANEITHGFDRDGQSIDENGQPNHLWTVSTDKKYKKMARCIDKQYETYLAKNFNLKGKSKKMSKIADNLGVKTAYGAYKQYLMLNGGDDERLPGLENYSPQQMFWISYANSLCARYTHEGLRQAIIKGDDVISPYRVLGPIFNSEEFFNDFSCPRNSSMYLVDKCDM